MQQYLCLLLFIFQMAPVCLSQSHGWELIDKSINMHDPNGLWTTAEFQVYIQEPRAMNPARYSKVYLDNNNYTFQLIRNREKHLVTYMHQNNKSNILFNGDIAPEDSVTIAKYSLDTNIVAGYHNYYHQILGLPMTLTSDFVKSIRDVKSVSFNNRDSYEIQIELNNPLFTNLWSIFIDRRNHTFLGIEMYQADNSEPFERLLFDQPMLLNGMQIPRVRHWYLVETDEFLGSDIIVKVIP